MNIRSGSDSRPSSRRLIEIALWLWVCGITAAYLHQFAFVLPLLRSLLG